MTSIGLILIDDHHLVRSGIRALLQAIQGVEILGEGSNAQDALNLVQDKQPDVVLLDIALPDHNGIDIARKIVAEQASTKVIMLSIHDSGEYVDRALRAGVHGYLLKDAAPVELQLALDAVSAGEVYLSPRVSRRVIELFKKGAPASIEERARLDALSPRQVETLSAIANGRSTKEIAYDLGLSVKTIETYRSQIMQKLDTRDVAGLVRFAIRVGLAAPDT